jgi:hypothetical protein
MEAFSLPSKLSEMEAFNLLSKIFNIPMEAFNIPSNISNIPSFFLQ